MNIGKILSTEITGEMEKSYLDYSMSVIVARALPDVRDGLKPVHRRILYAMHQMGLSHSSRYSKSAKVVGEVLGKYHPHGDIALYDALVRLAQNFSMRYPLIDGQGNFGSIDGDSPAAMRYTECRLSGISQELLFDIEKETINTTRNFDNTLDEPVFLPAKLPNLLLMGSEGIAVGMATKIPPHNLAEVVDAIITLIDKGKLVKKDGAGEESEEASRGEALLQLKKIDLSSTQKTLSKTKAEVPVVFESEASIDDLLESIKGPDFPTAGMIFDQNQIRGVYTDGRGTILVRGKAEIEETKSGKFQIVVSEIPYQVNKSKLVVKIAQLVKDRRIEGISDLRDESDRHGIRVVIELKRDARPKAVLNNLYKHTELQTTFPANIVALVDGTPMTLNLKQILTEYVRHRHLIVRRRSEYELKNAKARAHILEGLKIALDHLDAVIETIKKSKDAEEAKKNLIEKFGLTEIQATAILDMQLRRLAALERQKIEDEYKMVMETIIYLTDLLTHPEKIILVIKEEIIKLKEKYADERKTKVFKMPIGEFSEEDLVPSEETIITVTQTGYIKRVPKGTYRTQKRGGKGVMGMKTKEEDNINYLLAANTHDYLLFFTNRGRVFQQRVWDIPESSRQAKGQAIINLINIEQGELIQSILTIPKEKDPERKFLFLVTRKGTVKKTTIEQYANIRSSGLIAIKLAAGDELCWAKVTSSRNHILIVSHQGKSIRFSEKDVRPTARDTMGVRGIKLLKDDYAIGMEILPEKTQKPEDGRRKVFNDILVIMEKGLGKRTDFSEFPLQNRGGQGVKVAEVTEKTGEVVCCQLVNEGVEQVVLTSKMAQIIKLPLRNIPRLGRATQGVILMRFGKDSPDAVAAVTYLEKEGIEEE